MRKLADIGLMLNMCKSRFLVDDFGLLGFRVCNGYFSMAEKTLRGWADLQVPRSRKELKGLLGRL